MNIRLAALILMTGAVIFASIAVAVTGWGRPTHSIVIAAGVGSNVEWVLPGGPIWQAGVRPGQSVTEFAAGVAPERWALVTADESGQRFSTSYASILGHMRDALPMAGLALIIAAASWLLVRHAELAGTLAVLALVLSGQALMASELEVQSTACAVLALAAPAFWLRALATSWRRASLIYAGVVALVAAFWVIARSAEPSVFEPADLARQGTMWGGVAGTFLVVADWRKWRGKLIMLDSRRVADIFTLIVLLSVTIVVALVAELPILFVLLGAGVTILIYPAFRRRIADAIDDLLLGEMRKRASLTAVEDERGRIARDLHDAPLQEISAVIRTLDNRPDTQREAELLRQAAGHLRRVTTELRPPVLDDLGLHSALAYVADRARAQASNVRVVADINPSDPFSPRAPEDVELAVFRIVQEAVDNALRHSGAAVISIRATITPREVTATVTDDGVGLSDGAARTALVAGHAGLAGMAERASLIGASFSVSSRSPSGTEVQVQWQASS